MILITVIWRRSSVWINTVAQLNRLLYFNYHQKLGFDYEYSDKLFPYLHGLNDRDQQIHFVKETGKSVDKINHQLENLTINNFMFINATTDKKNIPNLINTMNIEDLVPPRSQYSNKKIMNIIIPIVVIKSVVVISGNKLN